MCYGVYSKAKIWQKLARAAFGTIDHGSAQSQRRSIKRKWWRRF